MCPGFVLALLADDAYTNTLTRGIKESFLMIFIVPCILILPIKL